MLSKDKARIRRAKIKKLRNIKNNNFPKKARGWIVSAKQAYKILGK